GRRAARPDAARLAVASPAARARAVVRRPRARLPGRPGRRLVGDERQARRLAGFRSQERPAFNRSFTVPRVFSHTLEIASRVMSAIAYDLRGTTGYLVADVRGKLVGRVECPMYGTKENEPDALSVKGGLFSRRRRLVPVDAIDQIDGRTRVIGLSVDRE